MPEKDASVLQCDLVDSQRGLPVRGLEGKVVDVLFGSIRGLPKALVRHCKGYGKAFPKIHPKLSGQAVMSRLR